jgi:hypothetical protein
MIVIVLNALRYAHIRTSTLAQAINAFSDAAPAGLNYRTPATSWPPPARGRFAALIWRTMG